MEQNTTTTETPVQPTFNSLIANEQLLQAIEDAGYTHPTPVQQAVIPAIVAGKDVMASAQTGTGKTAAYILPLLQNLMQSETEGIQAVVICPTRELALQIDQQIDVFSYYTGTSSIAVFGGNNGDGFDRQRSALTQGCDIVVCTPGRFNMHLALGYVNLDTIKYVILDEADRMLDMGFINDILGILSKLPAQRQTMLFSATFAPSLKKLALQILKEPEVVELNIAKPAVGIDQQIYLVNDADKINLLKALIKGDEVTNMIVFTSTKIDADQVTRQLSSLKLGVRCLHSGKEQDERNEVLSLFKSGKVQILVTTDVLSRGIDIEGLSHVLNYDTPSEPADYVHRIGRTARAQKTGVAITFVNPKDFGKLRRIEQLIGRTLEKRTIPVEIGTSPEYTESAGAEGNNRQRKPGNKRKFFKKKNNNRSGNGAAPSQPNHN